MAGLWSINLERVTEDSDMLFNHALITTPEPRFIAFRKNETERCLKRLGAAIGNRDIDLADCGHFAIQRLHDVWHSVIVVQSNFLVAIKGSWEFSNWLMGPPNTCELSDGIFAPARHIGQTPLTDSVVFGQRATRFLQYPGEYTSPGRLRYFEPTDECKHGFVAFDGLPPSDERHKLRASLSSQEQSAILAFQRYGDMSAIEVEVATQTMETSSVSNGSQTIKGLREKLVKEFGDEASDCFPFVKVGVEKVYSPTIGPAWWEIDPNADELAKRRRELDNGRAFWKNNPRQSKKSRK